MQVILSRGRVALRLALVLLTIVAFRTVDIDATSTHPDDDEVILPWVRGPILMPTSDGVNGCSRYTVNQTLLAEVARAFACEPQSCQARRQPTLRSHPTCEFDQDRSPSDVTQLGSSRLRSCLSVGPDDAATSLTLSDIPIFTLSVLGRASVGTSTTLNSLAATLEWEHRQSVLETAHVSQSETATEGRMEWIAKRSREAPLFYASPLGGTQGMEAAFLPLRFVHPSHRSSATGLLMLLNSGGVEKDELSEVRAAILTRLTAKDGGILVYSAVLHDSASVEILTAAAFLGEFIEENIQPVVTLALPRPATENRIVSRSSLMIHMRDVPDSSIPLQLESMRARFSVASNPGVDLVQKLFPRFTFHCTQIPVDAHEGVSISGWNSADRTQQLLFLHSHQELVDSILRNFRSIQLAAPLMKTQLNLIERIAGQVASCTHQREFSAAELKFLTPTLARPSDSAGALVSASVGSSLQLFRLSYAWTEQLRAMRMASLEQYALALLDHVDEQDHSNQTLVYASVREFHTTLAPTILGDFRQQVRALVGDEGIRMLLQPGTAFYLAYSMLDAQLIAVYETAILYFGDSRPVMEQLRAVQNAVAVHLAETEEIREMICNLQAAVVALEEHAEATAAATVVLAADIEQGVADTATVYAHAVEVEKRLEKEARARRKAKWFSIISIVALAWTGVGVLQAGAAALKAGAGAAIKAVAAKALTAVAKGYVSKLVAKALPDIPLLAIVKTIAAVYAAKSGGTFDSQAALKSIAPTITELVPGVGGQVARGVLGGIDGTPQEVLLNVASGVGRVWSQKEFGGDIVSPLVNGFQAEKGEFGTAALDTLGADAAADRISRVVKDPHLRQAIYSEAHETISYSLAELRWEQRQVRLAEERAQAEQANSASQPQMHSELTQEEIDIIASALEEIAARESEKADTKESDPATTDSHARSSTKKVNSRTSGSKNPSSSKNLPSGQALATATHTLVHESKVAQVGPGPNVTPSSPRGMTKAEWVSLCLDVLPIISTAKSWDQLITGRDRITQEKINRFVEAIGLVPIPGSKLVGKAIVKNSNKAIELMAAVIAKSPELKKAAQHVSQLKLKSVNHFKSMLDSVTTGAGKLVDAAKIKLKNKLKGVQPDPTVGGSGSGLGGSGKLTPEGKPPRSTETKAAHDMDWESKQMWEELLTKAKVSPDNPRQLFVDLDGGGRINFRNDLHTKKPHYNVEVQGPGKSEFHKNEILFNVHIYPAATKGPAGETLLSKVKITGSKVEGGKKILLP